MVERQSVLPCLTSLAAEGVEIIADSIFLFLDLEAVARTASCDCRCLEVAVHDLNWRPRVLGRAWALVAGGVSGVAVSEWWFTGDCFSLELCARLQDGAGWWRRLYRTLVWAEVMRHGQMVLEPTAFHSSVDRLFMGQSSEDYGEWGWVQRSLRLSADHVLGVTDASGEQLFVEVSLDTCPLGGEMLHGQQTRQPPNVVALRWPEDVSSLDGLELAAFAFVAGGRHHWSFVVKGLGVHCLFRVDTEARRDEWVERLNTGALAARGLAEVWGTGGLAAAEVLRAGGRAWDRVGLREADAAVVQAFLGHLIRPVHATAHQDSEDAYDPVYQVIAEVLHFDSPAEISPSEATFIEELQMAGRVERSLDIGTAVVGEEVARSERTLTEDEDEEDVVEEEPEDILLLEFARHPESFRLALMEGQPLQACRAALEVAGLSCMLPSGAKIFVHPRQYGQAVEAICQTTLRPFHVVVAASLEHLIAESLAHLSCRQGARVRSRHALFRVEASEAAADGEFCEQDAETCKEPPCQQPPVDEHDRHAEFPLDCVRTFLCSPLPLRHAKSVVQSSTEAFNHGINPRRAMPMPDFQPDALLAIEASP